MNERTIAWLKQFSTLISTTEEGELKELLMSKVERVLTLYYRIIDEGGSCSLPEPPIEPGEWRENIGEILDFLDELWLTLRRCFRLSFIKEKEARIMIYMVATIEFAMITYISIISSAPTIYSLAMLIGLAPIIASITLARYRKTSLTLLGFNAVYLALLYLLIAHLAFSMMHVIFSSLVASYSVPAYIIEQRSGYADHG